MGVHGLRPCFALVAAEHDEAGAAALVLAHEAAEFIAIGRTEDIRLAGVLAVELGAIAGQHRLGPGEAAIACGGLQHLQGALLADSAAAMEQPER
jgi:hypothetical protein